MPTNALDPLNLLEYSHATGRRAVHENLELTPLGGGDVEVRNASYGSEADDHVHTVHVVDGVPSDCTCKAWTYHDGACKHMVRVALSRPVIEAAMADGGRRVLAADGGEALPRIVRRREPVEQGGALYHRCEGCGRESIYGRESIAHKRGCPHRGGR